MSKRILVVEDQEDNRRIMRDLLAASGYASIEATTGDEGLAMAAREVPDLILMDIQLPGMDGYEVTRRIKADPALAHIPIIAVTSYALSGDDQKAFAAGCDGYVTKPFSPKVLLAKIREYLRGIGLGRSPIPGNTECVRHLVSWSSTTTPPTSTSCARACWRRATMS